MHKHMQAQTKPNPMVLMEREGVSKAPSQAKELLLVIDTCLEMESQF